MPKSILLFALGLTYAGCYSTSGNGGSGGGAGSTSLGGSTGVAGKGGSSSGGASGSAGTSSSGGSAGTAGNAGTSSSGGSAATAGSAGMAGSAGTSGGGGTTTGNCPRPSPEVYGCSVYPDACNQQWCCDLWDNCLADPGCSGMMGCMGTFCTDLGCAESTYYAGTSECNACTDVVASDNLFNAWASCYQLECAL